MKYNFEGKTGSLSVFTVDDFNEKEFMDILSKDYMVVTKDKGRLALTQDIVDTKYQGFLMNFEDMIKGKSITTRTNEFMPNINPYARTLRRFVLAEGTEDNFQKWIQELEPLRFTKYREEMYEGIVRECDGKKIAQGAQIYRLHFTEPLTFYFAIDIYSRENQGYAFFLHKTTEGKDALIKLYLAKWSWYIFDITAQSLLVNKVLGNEPIVNLSPEKYQTKEGQLYCI